MTPVGCIWMIKNGIFFLIVSETDFSNPILFFFVSVQLKTKKRLIKINYLFQL
jgi:hypothetical protein